MNAEPEAYPREALADEEPRYLRRQRPLEIRRRKFGRKSWPVYRRWLLASAVVLSGSFLAYHGTRFFLFSPRVALAGYDQIEVTGNQVVSRNAVTEIFASDIGKSIMRMPLNERRAELEVIPWVAQANVRRMLPNRIRVELTERIPVAYLRTGNHLQLVDAGGVVLERPLNGNFAFPVVSGLDEGMPLSDRAARMRLYVKFMKEIDLARSGSSEQVSEVDLSSAQDLRVALTGLLGGQDSAPILVHFGDADFVNKHRLLMDNIGAWSFSVGRVQSVDLRFSRQVVVNPDRSATAHVGAAAAGKP